MRYNSLTLQKVLLGCAIDENNIEKLLKRSREKTWNETKKIKPVSKKQKKWTLEEDRLLRQGKKPQNRSESAIRSRKSNLGLLQNPLYWSNEEILQLLDGEKPKKRSYLACRMKLRKIYKSGAIPEGAYYLILKNFPYMKG